MLRIVVSPQAGTENAIAIFVSNPCVEYAEKNFVGHLDSIPNDTYFSQQWGLNNTGQSGGTSDADIDAPDAWDSFTGSSDIAIAILDTGIDYDHPDLQGNIWTNPGETGSGKETNGIDDDGNGYVDDWRGWDFYDSYNDPMDDYYYQTFHGTHVSGIAGARGNNGTGISGVAWTSKLMALKVANYGGSFTTSTVINAIDYAIDKGARVINLSLAFGSYSAALYEAVERAMESGVLVVASAGNGNTNTDSSPQYPSCFDLDNVISVLSTDYNDNRSGFSSYGPYTVDLGAPGGSDNDRNNVANIYSTQRSNRYQYLSGTSMAAPSVSGAAALLLGDRTSIDWWQAKTIILKSVDAKSNLNGTARTNGRLNISSALNYPTPDLPDAPTDLEGEAYEDGGFYNIQLTWTDNADNETGFKIYLQTAPNVFAQVGSTGANVITYSINEVGPGTYVFFIRAYGTDGESLKTPNETVHII